MNTNSLALASGLSDQDLLARIGVLAGKEREASAGKAAAASPYPSRDG